jgi:HEAT repeat protein
VSNAHRDSVMMLPEAAEGRSRMARLRRWVGQARLAFERRRGSRKGPSAAATSGEARALAGLQSENPHIRWESASNLGRSAHRSPEAIAALVNALTDPEEFVRWQSAQALAAQEAAHVFPELVKALGDHDPLRRAGAAEAMGYQGGEAAAVTLCKQLSDNDPRVRSAAALALGDLADPTAVPCLLPLLDDQDAAARCAVASALGRIGSNTAARPLADALSRPGQPLLVRRALAAALIHAAHPETQPELLSALSDADPQVRGYAAEALGQIGDETSSAALTTACADQGALIQGTVGERARKALAALERRDRHSKKGG